jgi:hypothetical protein
VTEARRTYENANGVRRTLIVDDERPDAIIVQTEQDIEEILAGIERDRELHPSSATNKMLARVPIAVYERACLEQWGEDDWARWLNSSEAAPFRIWRGRV